MKSPIVLILVVVFVMFLSLSVANAQPLTPLLKPTTRTGTTKSQPDSTVIRSQNVIVDIKQLLGQNNRSLTVLLFDEKTLRLVRDRQEQTPKKGIVWYGKIADEPGSTVIFSAVKDVLIGNITTQDGKIYQIRYVGGGIHSLREIDQSKFPPEGEPDEPRINPDEGKTGDTCSTDAPTDIDVLVVYTGTSRSAAGGTDAIEANVFLALAETNQSYLNSNIDQRVRLAHMAEVTYTESGNSMTDRDRLQNGSDGLLDNVQNLRNTFAADLVIMIVENLENCGRAFIMNPVSNAFESFGYAVVTRNCATGNISFAHELGHIMGARHDWARDSTNNSPYTFNHGFVNASPTSPATPWRTIMSLPTTPGSTRILFWSNPNVSNPIGGDTMGVGSGSQQTDNHRTLNNTALTVANFRCSSPGVNNVWMKDTWSDTGAEPDANTTSEEMWRSPYIWIRNSQDTSLVHQHEHQNPVFGSTETRVYAKIHNGGSTATNGNLELYWANAATGLSWQADWNLLTTIPVNGFAARSTRVVEAHWNTLPAAGHYCLIARWVSASDPMTNPETVDINSNVRGNNNIVWRNLNIVDMGGDSSGDASFIVRNSDRRRAANSLVIRPPRSEMQNSFIRHGQVIVQFDDVLIKAWRRGGAYGKGFTTRGNTFVVTDPTGARFENIFLDPQFVGRVKLTFKKLPTTPKRRFLIDAVQIGSPKLNSTTNVSHSQVVGGVSYEIHTDKR